MVLRDELLFIAYLGNCIIFKSILEGHKIETAKSDSTTGYYINGFEAFGIYTF